MSIGETIRKMRKKADITQDDIAQLLHVTSQAVSRWETDASVPDVASLIGLARIFECSVDHILGVNEIKKEERIQYFKEKAKSIAMNAEDPSGNGVIQAYRDALTEYPNEYDVIADLAGALTKYSMYYEKSDIKKHNEMINEATGLYEYIIEHCPKDSLSADAKRQIYYILINGGQKKKAAEYLEYFPDIWNCRQAVEFKVGGEGEVKLFAALANMFEFYLSISLHDKKKTPEQKYEIVKQLETIYDTFKPEENRVPTDYIRLAYGYAEGGRPAEAMNYIKKAADLAVGYSNKTVKSSVQIENFRVEDWKKKVADDLTYGDFDALSDTEEFRRVLLSLAE